MRLLGIVLLLICVAGLILYLNPDLRNRVTEIPADLGLSDRTARLYKWRDANNRWQITDQLPPEGIEYEILDYHEDLNVLPRPPALQGD